MSPIAKIEAATIRMAKRIMKNRWSAADLCAQFNALTPPEGGTVTANVWLGSDIDAEFYEIGVFVGAPIDDDDGERLWSVSFVAEKGWNSDTGRWTGGGAKVHWIKLTPHEPHVYSDALEWIEGAAR